MTQLCSSLNLRELLYYTKLFVKGRMQIFTKSCSNIIFLVEYQYFLCMNILYCLIDITLLLYYSLRITIEISILYLQISITDDAAFDPILLRNNKYIVFIFLKAVTKSRGFSKTEFLSSHQVNLRNM